VAQNVSAEVAVSAPFVTALGNGMPSTQALLVTGSGIVTGTLRAHSGLAVGSHNVSLISLNEDRITTPNNFEVVKSLLVGGNIELTGTSAVRFASDTNLIRAASGVLRTDGALQVGTSLEVQGTSLVLGSAGTAFTVSLPQAASGRTIAIRGQAATAGAGGDLLLDAGTGTTAGAVLVGGLASQVQLGVAGRTVAVNGALAVAQDARVVGTLFPNAVSASGAITAATLTAATISTASLEVSGIVTAAGLQASGAVSSASLSVSGPVTVGGSGIVVGSLRLGAAAAYTIGRAVNTNAGRTTSLLGQSTSNALSIGGDLTLDGGSGFSFGYVHVGRAAEVLTRLAHTPGDFLFLTAS
jgi:hypothetical protein